MTSVERTRFAIPGRVLFFSWVIPSILGGVVAAQPGAGDGAVIGTLLLVAVTTGAIGLVIAKRAGVPLRRPFDGERHDRWFWAASAWFCAWGLMTGIAIGLTMAYGGVDSPFVSVVVPAFNEADVIVGTLERLDEHLHTLDSRFRWEVVVGGRARSDKCEQQRCYC